MNDWIEILSTPLPTDRVMAFVSDDQAGGIAAFLGTTRASANPDGRSLLALDYEAYEAMAIKQLRKMADESRRHWPIVKLVILHRIGRVELGQPSVCIAVSAPHRAQAFEACRWLIDTLKSEAVIWKQEVWGK